MQFIRTKIHAIKREGDVVTQDKIVSCRVYIEGNIESILPYCREGDKFDHTAITFTNGAEYVLAEEFDVICAKIDKLNIKVKQEESIIPKN